MNIFQLLSPKDSVTYMQEDVVIPDALNIIRESGYTAVPVINKKGEFVGVLREGDFLWAYFDNRIEDENGDPKKIRDIIDSNRTKAAHVETEINEVFRMALDQNFVPIVDDRNMFIGIITRKKVINNLLERII